MSWMIRKTFRFEAAHQLHGLPEGHQCGREHGHSYRVTLELTGNRLSGPGFVTDFGALKPFKDFVDDYLDHRDLNEVAPDEPTSEVLAAWLFTVAKDVLPSEVGQHLAAVKISETESSCAEFRP